MKDFFKLDKGHTKRILELMTEAEDMFTPALLDRGFAPWYSDQWTTNPFAKIANDDELWARYVKVHKTIKGKVDLRSYFRSLAICQFYVMNNLKGPEGDGAKQMLRKHWYAWGKLALQPAAIRLGIGLMPNGTPDSEKLYTMMSEVFGDWNEYALLEYQEIWIEDNTTQFMTFQETLPNPFDTIIVCCEKDAAYQGVALSAHAMGAWAVYSGGGKSSRAGIEKLYYSGLHQKVRAGRDVYVLVISDYDMDGEAVIAPTFAKQLSTYIPENQIKYARVGIVPDQVERFGHTFPSKWYDIKWDVGDQSNNNYLVWARDLAINEFSCSVCGYKSINLGTVCPSCGEPQLSLDLPTSKDAKAPFKRFFEMHSPKGFELDALPRVDYCELLAEGLDQLISWDDLCNALSNQAEIDEYSARRQIENELLSLNASYQEMQEYERKLRAWFDEMMKELEQRRYKIDRVASDMADVLIRNHKDDQDIFKDDPDCDPEGMSDHMKGAKFYLGQCTYCYRDISNCSDPEDHRERGYHQEVPEIQKFRDVRPYQPFSSEQRTDNLVEIILEKETKKMGKFGNIKFDYPVVDIDIE